MKAQNPMGRGEKVSSVNSTPDTGSANATFFRRIRSSKSPSSIGLLAAVGCCVAGLANADDSLSPTNGPPTVIVVIGAPGNDEYGQNFSHWAEDWDKGCKEAGAKLVCIGRSRPIQPLVPLGTAPPIQATDCELLKQALQAEPKESPSELWLVLLGHGTFDGKEPKFNLRGPDLSATNLTEWLQPFQRTVIVINCAASSGPFLHPLSRAGRIVVTATRSGYEQNYARFGEYFSAAILDLAADLDKDGQTSLLEAFLTASRRVAEFYKTEGRLATEHALLDDNGDGRGTPPDWFRGIRAVKKPADGSSVDGLRAHQIHLVRTAQERLLSPALRAKRDELELAVARLREFKEQLAEDEYYRRLEPLLIGLAHVYQNAQAESKGFE